MSADAAGVAMAAVLDAVSLLRGEVAALVRSNERLEQSQRDIMQRLDAIAAGQAPLVDLLPFLEAILAKTLEGDSTTHEWLAMLAPVLEKILGTSERHREAIEALCQKDLQQSEIASAGQGGNPEIAAGLEVIAGRLEEAVSDSRQQRKAGFTAVAELIGFTRAAVLGQRAPLPVDLEDHPLFERFILNQPADLSSTERAVVDWRTAVAAASTADLMTFLRKQQQPSPTDTPQTRLMRYRWAAITRAQIEGRGAVPPAPPTTTRATDRSAATCLERSRELAELWRAGESTALYAEPELAGAIDLFDAAERRVGSALGGAAPPELVTLHRDLADRIESGDRPQIGDGRPDPSYERALAVEPSKDR